MVIPDGVYEFALDPKTGEATLPKPDESQLQALEQSGMGTAFEKRKAEGDAEEMERLIRESEMRKQGGAETIIINNNNVDNSVKSSSQTLTTQSITEDSNDGR